LAFVVSHINLIDQTVEEFNEEGIKDVGVIQADHHMTDWSKPIQICSIQTLRSKKKLPDCKLAIFDECHVLHKLHKEWLQHPDWQHVPIIGLSATPWTKGLGKYFDSLLIAASTQELIDKGLLAPFRVFATGHPDLTGVKTVAGDYHEGQLSDVMQRGSLTADIVRTWQARWGKDKTFVFGVDCKHAQALQQRFIDAGISAAYQDALTPLCERKTIKEKFHRGEYRVICNVGTLTIGVDYDVRCLVLARPTKSEMLFVQIVGRALRTAPGKDYALILDHSDTTQRLGFVTDIDAWHMHLDDGKPVNRPERREPLPKPCPRCDCLKPRVQRKCPNCGFEMVPTISDYIEREGDLVEITKNQLKRWPRIEATMAEKAAFFAGLKYICLERGYKSGWAANKYRSKFGVWPDHRISGVSPSPPPMAVRQWVRSTQIAWAYSKRRAEELREKVHGYEAKVAGQALCGNDKL
jgi:superfamily II DNA or RNA helicase